MTGPHLATSPAIDALLRCVLDPALVPPEVTTLRAWWDATDARRTAWSSPIDRALVGGACADRLGFAFAGGYTEALRALVPDTDGITALCATEEGGNRPRAIQTSLVPGAPGRYLVTGRKKWATVASEASKLLVVASVGGDADGKNRLRVVRIPAAAPGVRIHASTVAFVPEIPHAEIELDRVEVDEADVLPGDGYDAYLKPFRTIEDLHVHAALLGYLIGVARRHGFPHETIEPLLAVAVTTRALAQADVAAATTHVTIAGLLAVVSRLVADLEQRWSAAPDDEWARWQRDRVLLQVAGTARTARRERAWSVLARRE
jgi:hypothetical protein